MTRWERLYIETRDEALSARPSLCARTTAAIFTEQRSKQILDLGCGIGRDTFYLAACNLSVIGIDAAESGLAMANSRRESGRKMPSFAGADARALPFPDASFDGVYCFGVLHEFTGETREHDVSAVMQEIHRVLVPEGLLVLAVLSGQPEEGLPHVYLFTEQAFDDAAYRFQVLEKRTYNDIGATGKTDYHIWYGLFGKRDDSSPGGMG